MTEIPRCAVEECNEPVETEADKSQPSERCLMRGSKSTGGTWFYPSKPKKGSVYCLFHRKFPICGGRKYC